MVGALRFFYLTVLNKRWRGHELPYPRKTVHLPVIWSPEEIASLIDAAPTPFYRTILMTELRQHYRRLQPKPTVWLFPGGTRHTADTPITEKVVWHACRRAAERCGVNKPLQVFA